MLEGLCEEAVDVWDLQKYPLEATRAKLGKHLLNVIRDTGIEATATALFLVTYHKLFINGGIKSSFETVFKFFIFGKINPKIGDEGRNNQVYNNGWFRSHCSTLKRRVRLFKKILREKEAAQEAQEAQAEVPEAVQEAGQEVPEAVQEAQAEVPEEKEEKEMEDFEEALENAN